MDQYRRSGRDVHPLVRPRLRTKNLWRADGKSLSQGPGPHVRDREKRGYAGKGHDDLHGFLQLPWRVNHGRSCGPGGARPFSLAGDSADPDHVLVRTTAEEARHVFRARLLNPIWIEGLKRHGYKGAGDLSKAMDIILGWDATAGVVEDWMYRRFAEKTALDKTMQEWMKRVNPYALHNILDKLLEATSRGLWQAAPEMLDDLRNAFLDVEGEIEEATESDD